MNVYEVEIASNRPDQKILQHVRAVDATEARSLVRGTQGASVTILGVSVLRALWPDEVEAELKKRAAQ